ncbi:COG4223 family protein [Loktanella sp. M215]|uniref:COG4223 family protein n=1 Tax=Loktanella sp. M215 TaxID=2675431 RepID=UPI001F220508|nr:hypothetical protein [Loktanella sp. M215]MCF7698620.1 hypothetical protein [Loktanella sp. M215]
MATQPAKRRSPKAKPNADQTTEAVTVPEPVTAVTAMPPPTLTPHTQPETAPATRPTADAEPVTTPEPVTSRTPDTPAPQPAPRPAQATAPERRQGGFFPLLLGGIVAGGIGYGIAYTQFGQPEVVDLSGLQGQIDALQAQVNDMPPPAELSGVTQQISDLSASVDSRLAALNDQVAQAAQQAPAIGPEAQQQAVDQISAQITAQQDELAQQQAAVEQQRADLQAQIDATRAEAEQIQQQAVDAARTETARAALARVQGSIESGAPMQAALSDLGASLTDPVPDALTAVSEGTPTLTTLRETFPEASRAALSAARAAGEAGDSAGAFGSFLRNQLNVRSVAPRDGESADAVLSRAEDALRNGRLNDALAEIATLPESARAAMSDWTAQAEARAAAVDAADQLDASLTAN